MQARRKGTGVHTDAAGGHRRVGPHCHLPVRSCGLCEKHSGDRPASTEDRAGAGPGLGQRAGVNPTHLREADCSFSIHNQGHRTLESREARDTLVPGGSLEHPPASARTFVGTAPRQGKELQALARGPTSGTQGPRVCGHVTGRPLTEDL